MINSKKKIVFYFLIFTIIIICPPAVFGKSAARPATQGKVVTHSEAQGKIAMLYRAGNELNNLGRQPQPPGLKGSGRTNEERYNRWLLQSGQELITLGRKWEVELGKLRASGQMKNRATKVESKPYPRSHMERVPSQDTDKILGATKEMQEMNKSFNLQYLQLQSKIYNENRQFTMISNIMKNKHDTAKNSINNIR